MENPHAAIDNDLALLIKATLEEELQGIEVFCSSDPADLPPGTKWPVEIQKKLNTADILLLLATPRGLKRPWVWFECGTFWFSTKKLIPLCFGEIRKKLIVNYFWISHHDACKAIQH